MFPPICFKPYTMPLEVGFYWLFVRFNRLWKT